MKRAWPTVHITWVVEPMPAGVLQPHPAIDNVIVFHKKKGIAGVRELKREMAQQPRADITLDLNIYFKSVFPTVFSRAPERWGFDKDRARDGVWLFCNRHIPPGPRRHTQDLFLEFLEALDVPAAPLVWNLQITEAERAQQRELKQHANGRDIVAIVPASANALKDWSAQKYAEVISAIERDYGMYPVLIGGPGERETAVAREIERMVSPRPLNAMGNGVRRLVWQIDAAALVIAPDTGPVHIARALETPVIGLYGHTNPWRVGPYRWCEDLWVDRYNDENSVPDASVATPKHGRMEMITARDVLEKIDRWQARRCRITS
jgi:heptosyltransferase I